MDTMANVDRSARAAFHICGAIGLCVAIVVGISARHRWSDGIAERFGWAAPWVLYVTGGLTVAFVVLLFLWGEFELDRLIFRDPSMIPLSTSERLRVMGLCVGIAGGAVAVSIALFTPVDPLRSFSDFGDAPLLVLGTFLWVWCSGSLMGQSWEDHHIASERARRQEEVSRWNAGWRKRIATLRHWIQPTTPVGTADRFAREWLILVGFMTLSGALNAPGAGTFGEGALWGVVVYIVALPVRLTVWSFKRVFNSSKRVRQ